MVKKKERQQKRGKWRSSNFAAQREKRRKREETSSWPTKKAGTPLQIGGPRWGERNLKERTGASLFSSIAGKTSNLSFPPTGKERKKKKRAEDSLPSDPPFLQAPRVRRRETPKEKPTGWERPDRRARSPGGAFVPPGKEG